MIGAEVSSMVVGIVIGTVVVGSSGVVGTERKSREDHDRIGINYNIFSIYSI